MQARPYGLFPDLKDEQEKGYALEAFAQMYGGAEAHDAVIDFLGQTGRDALKGADILPGEKVLIANLTNGARLESYAIEGKAGSGVVCLNGGAAKHGKPGDKVIIISFVVMSEDEIKGHRAKVIRVDEKNRIIS